MAKKKRMDMGLKFLHQVVGLPSLHVGLYTDGITSDLEGVKAAQAEYSKAIAALVPRDAARVLDVGCGLGDTSKIIKGAGHHVEGLSPDAYHGEQYRLACGNGSAFHHTRFENFAADHTYDCLLFGECTSYIKKDVFFSKCIELTKPGSYLVAADFFQIVPNEAYKDFYMQDDFVARAEKAGFKQEYHRDITREVLPTFEISNVFLGYARRLHKYCRDSLKRSRPFLWRLGNIIYRKRLANLDDLLNRRLPSQLDPETFRRNMRYAMYRFKRST